ncbi:MAG: glycosyltransferase family 2 protein [Pseudomonadota bacterium]
MADGKNIKICVGLPTRGRGEMFVAALDSLAKQKLDGNLSLTVIVVENDPVDSLSDKIQCYDNASPDIRFRYVHVRDTGISNARNAALNFAKQEGADYLAFIDDDEVADEQWISSLYRELKERKLNLVGGPMRIFSRSQPPLFRQRLILDCLIRRSIRKELQARGYRDNGKDGRIMLCTNNWMADLDFVCAKNLRFQPRFNLVGGEDSCFFTEAKEHNATTGWAPDAIVYEEQPVERLSAIYQLRRARDQSIVSFERKYSKRPVYALLVIPISVSYSVLVASVFLALTPFTVGRTLLTSVRLFGKATGRLMGLLGIRTEHYSQTTGY